jgi:hypothetical protein
MMMCTGIKQLFTGLSAICIAATIFGCSIFVSTPPTARIRIQGLDNKLYEHVIALDAPVEETNVEIRISEHNSLQLDFEWLWNSDAASQINDSHTGDEDSAPPLIPWVMCNYRF